MCIQQQRDRLRLQLTTSAEGLISQEFQQEASDVCQKRRTWVDNPGRLIISGIVPSMLVSHDLAGRKLTKHDGPHLKRITLLTRSRMPRGDCGHQVWHRHWPLMPTSEQRHNESSSLEKTNIGPPIVLRGHQSERNHLHGSHFHIEAPCVGKKLATTTNFKALGFATPISEKFKPQKHCDTLCVSSSRSLSVSRNLSE